MNISVFGAGYVGLVTAACFAEVGHQVVCCDHDTEKVQALSSGRVPFYEPGLSELVANGGASGRLTFTRSVAEALSHARVAVLAVGTPSNTDGSTDLSQILAVAGEICANIQGPLMVLVKSTVPVGTNAKLAGIFEGTDTTVVSNPEFLKEGSAVSDGLKPDRIIVGSRDTSATELLRELYEPFSRNHDKLVFMTPESAELVKYGANAMLATRISFMNELAEYAARVGADIEDVRKGIGADSRIGSSYLYAGIGFGGSCFPKDLRSLGTQMSMNGISPNLVNAVIARNDRQIELIEDCVRHVVHSEPVPVVAIWGVAFKPSTDDIREAPALKLAVRLLSTGMEVRLADPIVTQAQVDASLSSNSVTLYSDEFAAARGADVVVLATEWRQYRSPNFDALREVMRGTVVVDGRNQWSKRQVESAGLDYFGIGRN
jgi:UDPglucose 6-dehydrogenase